MIDSGIFILIPDAELYCIPQWVMINSEGALEHFFQKSTEEGETGGSTESASICERIEIPSKVMITGNV